MTAFGAFTDEISSDGYALVFTYRLALGGRE